MVKRYPLGGSITAQCEALDSYCDDIEVLQDLITVGHADVHYRGSEKLPNSMEELQNVFYQNDDYRAILPRASTLAQQTIRVANEVVPASHFINKSTMYAALSETILGCSADINSWINRDKSNHMCRLRLTVDAGTFVGTGINTDGNEYATSAVTIVLGRRPTASMKAGRIPFSIITMYPNITGAQNVGTLVATGRSCVDGLVTSINNAPVGAKMYWALQNEGISSIFSRSEPVSALISGQYNGVDFVLRYNEKSYHAGQILLKGRNGCYEPFSHSYSLPYNDKVKLLDIEKEFHPLFDKARDKNAVVVDKDSLLFTKAEEGLIFENGQYRDISETRS